MSALLFLGQTAPLLGNPTGGDVVAGSATIGAAGPTLTVNQATQNAIINWQTFSIANGETTKFIVPNSASATLNRVVGGNPSAIYGNLQSNGILYLVNPSGIVVGPSGRIDTASFLASTLDVSNEQFLAGGKLEFAGSSGAAINNAGVIHASTGDVYLIADQVNNTGKLSAKKGTVGLAAGTDVLYQQAGNDHLFVKSTPAGATRATGVTNAGTIRAAAAELKAAGGNAYALAINNTGVIAATGYKKVNGQVYLTSDGGSITNAGTISARQANGNGGKIVLSGTAKKLTTSGIVTNSGTLDASAIVAGGKGGTISVKDMTGTTVQSGSILAKGGQGGAGGSAEISGAVLSFAGGVNLTAPGGKTGNLLLDPITLDVTEGVGGSIFSNENDPGQSTIGNETVDDALETANITLNADNGITIDNAIEWSSANTLTLSTNNTGSTIQINAAIGGFSGTLAIDTAGSTDQITGGGYIEVNSFTLQNGSFIQNQSVALNGILPIFSASTFQVLGQSSFLRVATGDGLSTATAYQVTDVYGLEGLGSPSGAYLNKDADLANNIGASGLTSFTPIGSDPVFGTGAAYSGTFNGQNYTIDGVHIASSGSYIGLFGEIAAGGVVENLGVTNLSISSNIAVGGLVGFNYGTITNAYTTGAVTGNESVGGLAGYNVGTISDSYSYATVSGTSTTPNGIGGFVGYNNGGNISQSYSAGAVGTAQTGSFDIGGFSGANDGTISNSYSIGSVTVADGASSVGGFSGDNQNGTITNAYSSGSISIGATASAVGGFVGNNGNTITGSFFDDSTTVFQNGVGGGTASSGVTGYTTPTLLFGSTYAGVGWNIGTNPATNTWVIFNGQTRPLLGMEYSPTITNAHQLQLIGLSSTTLAANYAVNNTINLSDVVNPSDIWATSPSSGAGFLPIGSGSNFYTGTFNGQGNTIVGLYINMPTGDDIGLFGVASNTLENVNLVGVDVNGGSIVGGLVGSLGDPSSGTQSTGVITDVSVTGVVNGGLYTGGLAGLSHGTLIDQTYTAGVVNGSGFTGGLVGSSLGTISNSFSVAAVSGSGPVGGLVGENYTGGMISDSYSAGTVIGTSETGAFVGRNSATIQNSFWDTNVTALPGVGNGSVAGLTGATTAQLTDPAFITANAPVNPTWDFESIWTTNGGTTTPQLYSLPATLTPMGGSSTDTLSGDVFTDNFGTIAAGAGLTIDLLSNGSVILTTMTGPGGTYTFSVSSTVLSGGVLLTDATDNGNTYYQANTPALTIAGIDIWGGALRIQADTASNAALATASGSGRGNGINFSVVGSALSSRGAVDIDIVSNFPQNGVVSQYTLDGDITAGGMLNTAASTSLNGNTSVTLTGTSVALAGTFNTTGSVSVVSTTGDITLTNVGLINSPANTGGLSLDSAGAVYLYNSYLATNGGDFTALGAGDSNIPDGVDIINSVVDSQGGSLTLTGQSTTIFDDDQSTYTSGIGVWVDNSILETASNFDDDETGDITINGNGQAGNSDVSIPVQNNLVGVNITNSIVTVVDGTLAITGTVHAGQAQAVLNQDGSSNLSSGHIFGVLSNDGSLITASGLGSVSITGNTTGSTAQLFNTGVDLSGLDSNTGTIANSFVSVAGGTTGLTITGTAGAIGNSPVGTSVETPNTTGVTIEYGANVTAAGSAPITITGTGGTDENTSDAALTDESSLGISINAMTNGASGGTPNISIASAGGTVTLTGFAGSSIGNIGGISVDSSGGASASISSLSGNISLTGTTPNEGSVVQVLSSTGSGGAAGVDIEGDYSVGSVSSITASAGSIYIKGAVSSGSDNSKEAGVFIHNGAAITASGTGGTVGAKAQGDLSIFGNTSGSTAQSISSGIFISGLGATLSASGILADSTENTGLTLDGTASTIDGSTGATLDDHNGMGGVAIEPLTAGIAIIDGASLSALGASPITLNGTGGTNASTANSDTAYVSTTDGGTSASYGVAVFTPASGLNTSVSSGSSLTITGTAGSSPIDGVGVMLGGPNNVGDVSLSAATNVTITGTGGPGNEEVSVPNAGVGIFDPGNNSGDVNVIANGGNLSITGSSGGGEGDSTGIDGQSYFNTVDNTSSFDPGLNASGSVLLVSNAGSIDTGGFAGEITAQSLSITAPVGTASSIVTDTAAGPLSLNGGDFTVSVYPATAITLAASTVTSLVVNSNGGLTLTGPINSSGPVTLQDIGGNITFAANGSINSTSGNVIVAAGDNLADSHYIINNSALGANFIQSSGGVYLFSSDPTYDTLGNFTVTPDNMFFNATYITGDLPEGNTEFFYAGMGAVGPNSPMITVANTPPSVTTGGAAGGQSNIVPPALTPTVTQVTATTTPIVTSGGNNSGVGGGSQPPPLSFVGTGISTLLGQTDGSLAAASSNSGLVGGGDVAQLGGGGLSNANNPHAAGALNLALGPIVYQNLADALKAMGDWADVPDESDNSNNTASNNDGSETILTGGDVAELTGSGVKNIPIDKAPVELRNALNGELLTGADH